MCGRVSRQYTAALLWAIVPGVARVLGTCKGDVDVDKYKSVVRFNEFVDWLERNAYEIDAYQKTVQEEHESRQQQMSVWYSDQPDKHDAKARYPGRRMWLVRYDRHGIPFSIQRVGQEIVHFLPARVTEMPTEQEIAKLCSAAVYQALSQAYPWEYVARTISNDLLPSGAAILHRNGGVVNATLKVQISPAH